MACVDEYCTSLVVANTILRTGIQQIFLWKYVTVQIITPIFHHLHFIAECQFPHTDLIHLTPAT